MTFFITEKETEQWLTLETRTIPWVDGTRRPLTDYKLVWRSLDFILSCDLYTEQNLVDLAIRDAKETDSPFEDAFRGTLLYIHRHFVKTGYDEFSKREHGANTLQPFPIALSTPKQKWWKRVN